MKKTQSPRYQALDKAGTQVLFPLPPCLGTLCCIKRISSALTPCLPKLAPDSERAPGTSHMVIDGGGGPQQAHRRHGDFGQSWPRVRCPTQPRWSSVCTISISSHRRPFTSPILAPCGAPKSPTKGAASPTHQPRLNFGRQKQMNIANYLSPPSESPFARG